MTLAVRDAAWSDGLAPLLLWGILAGLSNALQAPATTSVYLSMSSPVNIAVALLFPPATAAVLVAASAVSMWEIRGEATLLRASFNRMQIGLSTLAAASFLQLADGPTIATTLLAVAGYHGVNWILVALAEWTARGRPVIEAFRGLLPRQPLAAATYLVLGTMGVVLALAFDRIGWWSVALLMLPLLSARQAVEVSQRLESLERERRRFADRLVDERDRERVRIAGDIHDVALQTLAAAKLDAETAATASQRGDDETRRTASARVEQAIDQAIANLRAAIFDLRHRSLGTDGLLATAERFGRSFGHEHDCEVVVNAGGGPWTDLGPSLGMLLYDCVQEGLVNANRHADAARVVVRFERLDGLITVTVDDDGHADRPARAPGARGTGLEILRQKLAYVGGSLDLHTSSTGSRLSITVPVEARS